VAEERNHFAEIISESSEQLINIITTSTIEAGQEKVEEKEFDLNSLLKKLHESYLNQIEKKNKDVRLNLLIPDGELSIKSDETKLVQVLSSLINNALKFTMQGFVDFGYAIKGNELEFFVKDTGVGIPKEIQDGIFMHFRKEEGETTKLLRGSGLGLFISKAYIELLGGHIWLDSELNQGSTFFFVIPLKRAKKNFLSTTVYDNLNYAIKTPLTILVAEDEDYNYLFLEALLYSLNIDLLRANNGLEAVELCKTNKHIDLILMDLKMPVLDGFEATKQIKQFMPDIPIIAQTAYAMMIDKDKAFEYGCDDFICKPFRKENLISKIMGQLNKA
jgi:CheY-like chemotaxis protein